MTQPALFAAPRPPVHELVDLRCCDVGELLETVEGADLVFADPPWSYRNDGDPMRSAAGHYACLPMSAIAEHAACAFAAAARDAYLVVWYAFPLLAEWAAVHSDIGWNYLSGGAWVKTGAPGGGIHWRGNAEGVALYRKGKPRPTSTAALRSGYVKARHRGQGEQHSEKPIEWQAAMIRHWCPPGGLVLDLYAGLGSVARATLSAGEGRRYVGAEVDPKRHAAALALLAQHRVER